MTVVAGLVTPEGAWIGADSLSSTDDGLASLIATPKVGRFGNLLLGYSGSFRVGAMSVSYTHLTLPTNREV